MRKKSTVDFIAELNEANPLIEVLGNYVNSRTKIRVKGIECGHVWDSRPYDLLKGHECPVCRYVNNSERTKMSNEQFVEKLRIINPSIEPLDEYVTSQKAITVRCKICQYVWTVKPNTLLNGIGCANCAGIRKKTSEEFVEKLNLINPAIEVLGKYDGQRSKIHVRCKNCGYEWNPTAKALLIGRSCPECNKAGTSFMEQFILAAFRKELGEEQVISRERDTVGVELDIFIPSKAVAIEPGSWYWHKDLLKKDAEKRDQCKKMGIRIVTIYDTYPNTKKKAF